MARKVNITLSIGRGFAWQNANLWRDANGRKAIFASFWAQVNREKAKGADCWLWSGTLDRHGFGVLEIGRNRVLAPLFAWLAARGGELRDGAVLESRCGNGRCVNPTHLRVHQFTS